jgi:hypothetical protein
MPRSLLSKRPRAKHGVHRFRNMQLDYNGQMVPGLYIVIDLERLGLKRPAILAYLERLERQAAKQALLNAPCATARVQ